MDQHAYCPSRCTTRRHRWADFDDYEEYAQAERVTLDEWNEWQRRYSECWYAPSAADSDRRWPALVLDRLGHTIGLDGLGKGDVIRHWRQAVESYQGRRIERDLMESARLVFLADANALIDFPEFLRTGRPTRPRNPSERRVRTRWLAIEQRRQARAELGRQRELLRTGRESLRAIRRVLRGQDPLPQPESTPERSSPT